MEDIKVVYTFILDDGMTNKITVRDLAENLSQSELISLGNKMISLNGEYNGSKYVSLKDCERITTNTEKFDL